MWRTDFMGWSESMVSRRLRGKTEIAAWEIARIADWLDVEPGVILQVPNDEIVRSR